MKSKKFMICFLLLLLASSLLLYSTCFAWDPSDYTAFLVEQIAGENQVRVSTYSTWMGPETSWPIATDDESEGGAWKTTVSAYDEHETLLGYIDVPQSAGGLVDYTAYVSQGIKYIRVMQASGSDSGFLEVVVTAVTCTATFISDGEVYLTETVEAGQTLDEPSAPAKESFIFEGWYTDDGFSSKAIFPCTVADDVTFYAKWSAGVAVFFTQAEGENAVTISYEFNGIKNWVRTDNADPEWNAVVTACDNKMAELDTIEIPGSAEGYVDYTGFIKRSIKCIKVELRGQEFFYNVVKYNSVFRCEQVENANKVILTNYCVWPDETYPVAAGGEWGSVVTAYDAGKNILGTIDIPESADGVADYSAYVTAGIKYIKVTQGGNSSRYFEVVVTEVVAPATGVYLINPLEDDTYSVGETSEGLATMTVKGGCSGQHYFTVNVVPVEEHPGLEVVLFVHLRNNIQLSINATKADFDMVNTAMAGFNVQAGDLIKSFIVDDLTNALDFNPTVLQ